ncbi:unnamed protein product [Caenorhabditis angaria]|uniref:Uncharacterized protein n=1 Tax=Caenorhabditis angaria TaxID=860376 RepID=A0A9P1IL10_9PELO|nr:unnamed protein product [Caenorhabditis angaria]
MEQLTKTPLSYRDRITFEFAVYGTCVFLNSLLCLFFLLRFHLWHSFKPTICFVTFGTFILSLPLLALQIFLVINLWSRNEPQYTVAICTFVKCFTSATTSMAQVLPLPVAIYRYFLVVQNKKLSLLFVISTHFGICLMFLAIAILNFPLGISQVNDQCEKLIFSNVMEAVRISLTLGLNLFAVLINCVIWMFVRKYDKREVDIHRRRIQLTYSMLLQSMIPILVSIPLLVGSLDFYFGYTLPYEFTSRWYATTFLSPFLTPISSMLSLRVIRLEILEFFVKSRRVIIGGRKISSFINSKLGARPSSDYSSA